MRVIDERSGARRCHVRNEGGAGRDRRCHLPVGATPSRNAVIVAFQFNTVPVNRGRYLHSVHDFDFHRLSAGENNRGADQAWLGKSGGRLATITKLQCEPRSAGTFAHEELQLALRTPWFLLSCPARGRHGYAEHELSHAGGIVHGGVTSIRRGVSDDKTG